MSAQNEITVPCPRCSGTGTDAHEDRHTKTNRDTCQCCGGTGSVPAATGQSPDASAPPLSAPTQPVPEEVRRALTRTLDLLEGIRDTDGGWDSDAYGSQVIKEISTLLSAQPTKPTGEDAGADWREDPAADERWNAGLDYGMEQLCAWLGVDRADVSWDAATETLDGDVRSILGNILRQKFGDNFDFKAVVPLNGDATPAPAPIPADLARTTARKIVFGIADRADVPWDPDQSVVVRAGRVESEILAALSRPDTAGEGRRPTADDLARWLIEYAMLDPTPARRVAGALLERDDSPLRASPSPRPDTAGDGEGLERVRHVKRGSEYEVLHRDVALQVSWARLSESADGGWRGKVRCLGEGKLLVVYRGDDGKLWAREEAEFDDGRFERLDRAAPSSQGEG